MTQHAKQETAPRTYGAIVDVIRAKGFAFAVTGKGQKVFVHQRNFRERGRIAFDGNDLLANQKRTIIRRGMPIHFVMAPPPEGRNLPEALDVVLSTPQ